MNKKFDLTIHLGDEVWYVTSKCKLYFLLKVEVFILFFVLLPSIFVIFFIDVLYCFQVLNVCHFCSNPKCLPCFFPLSNFLLYILFKSQVFIILYFQFSTFNLMSHLNFGSFGSGYDQVSCPSPDANTFVMITISLEVYKLLIKNLTDICILLFYLSP